MVLQPPERCPSIVWSLGKPGATGFASSSPNGPTLGRNTQRICSVNMKMSSCIVSLLASTEGPASEEVPQVGKPEVTGQPHSSLQRPPWEDASRVRASRVWERFLLQVWRGALQMCGVWQNLLELKLYPTLVRSPRHAEDV